MSLHSTESSLLHDNVAFVLCLDSLGSGDELFLHVSRPSKPKTPQFNFIQQLEEVRPNLVPTFFVIIILKKSLHLLNIKQHTHIPHPSHHTHTQVISSRFPWVKFATIHKKINLQESTLAWEHERYGMRHILGFTLSHLQDPRSERRGSILDTM